VQHPEQLLLLILVELQKVLLGRAYSISVSCFGT